MKLLRPMDLVYLRCPDCGAPAFTVDELLNPVYVDRWVEIAAAVMRDNQEFQQRCEACRQQAFRHDLATMH